jgi:hypothetical protein
MNNDEFCLDNVETTTGDPVQALHVSNQLDGISSGAVSSS